MKVFVPADYGAFACLKGECRHTCCAGWEIDIDPDTLALYRQVPPPLGDRLRRGIQEKDGVFSFRLDEKGRCPMLDGDNLCSVIRALGEGGLCGICADHPRYRNYFSDRVEMGLGLCCEAAARQTVYRQEPFRLTEAEEDGEECGKLTEREETVLSFREELSSLLGRNERPYAERETEALRLFPRFTWPGNEETFSFLTGLERLDGEWDGVLSRLNGSFRARPCSPAWDRALGQLAVSFLYRHLPDAAEDGLLFARALFALWSVRLLSVLTEGDSLDCLAETARMYSAEIEYSDENLQACFAWLDRCFA